MTYEQILAAWKAAKRHDDEIMARRPNGVPRSAWRHENAWGGQSTWRCKWNGKPATLVLNIDTSPAAHIVSASGQARILAKLDLTRPDALDGIEWPGDNDMVNYEFAAIRARLGLTQTELAKVLDYKSYTNVSAMEAASAPRKIPSHIARLMRAYDSGYRPNDWPK